jgi:nitroreductase
MDVFEAIAKRYSYRGEFTEQFVPRSDLEKIVRAGVQAPSGCNEQVVSFVIIDDPRLLAQIAEIVVKPVCATAGAMIACVIDPRPVYHGLSFAAEDCAAAVENMLLAITALGYASVWLDGALRMENRALRIGELIGVPPDKIVRIILPIGVPLIPGTQREKLPFNQRAWFNQWGGGGEKPGARNECQ